MGDDCPGVRTATVDAVVNDEWPIATTQKARQGHRDTSVGGPQLHGTPRGFQGTFRSSAHENLEMVTDGACVCFVTNLLWVYNLYILQVICIIKTIKGSTYHGD